MYDKIIYINVRIFILLQIQLSFLDYTMNNFSEDTEVKDIVKQWNIDNLDFYLILEVSICVRLYFSYT